MKHTGTKKARIIGNIANHPGPMQSASKYCKAIQCNKVEM